MSPMTLFDVIRLVNDIVNDTVSNTSERYIPGIKVVAVLVITKESGHATILNMAMAGNARHSHLDHAESLLCNINDITNGMGNNGIHMITTKVPCKHCAMEIINKFGDYDFTLHMPRKIDLGSKWHESQIAGFQLLKDNNIDVKIYG